MKRLFLVALCTAMLLGGCDVGGDGEDWKTPDQEASLPATDEDQMAEPEEEASQAEWQRLQSFDRCLIYEDAVYFWNTAYIPAGENGEEREEIREYHFYDFEGYPRPAPTSFYPRGVQTAIYEHRLIDEQGRFITPVFRSISSFSEGMAAFENESRLWGYLNESGEIVIEPQYRSASDFYDGRALVVKSEGYRECVWTIIDREGNEVIEAVTSSITPSVREGIVQYLEEDRSVSYMDMQGNFLFNCAYGVLFQNGIAYVHIAGDQGLYFGVIRRDGSLLYRTEHPVALVYSSQSDSWVVPHNLGSSASDDGQIVAIPLFETQWTEQGYRSVAVSSANGASEPAFTYIGLDGEALGIVNHSPTGFRFRNGRAFYIGEDGERGYIDATGKLVIDFALLERELGLGPGQELRDSWDGFERAFAVIRTQDDQYGVIDRDGNVVVALRDGYLGIRYADEDYLVLSLGGHLITKVISLGAL